MVSKITIDNAKNIKHMEFIIPPSSGVYLLVGPNGSGKTTLLSCLDRIGNPLAFAKNFVSSKYNDEVDQYKSAIITYEIDQPRVHLTCRKKNKRWSFTPKNGNRDLTQFGFASTVFIQADSKRIDIPSDDIRQGNFVSASQEVKNSMNMLFETKRYGKLKRLKNTYGRGKKAQYYYVIKEGSKYYSEKRFSTGELALLRLVERISVIPEHSLILLDEAEMALHPRIQKNLLDYLNYISDEKHLTVIIATHSITMIKAVDKFHILMLEEHGSGKYEVVTPCYPAKAIGCIDYIENTSYDTIFFVEDDMARLLLKKMVQRCLKDERYSTINACYVPVGGYEQTAMLALNTKDMLFNSIKVFAVWDEDVFTETMIKNERIKKFYENNKDVIYNLGCTPELWMVDALESGNIDIIKAIRGTFHIEVKSIMDSEEYRNCNSAKPRQLAKDKMDVIVKMMSSFSGSCKDIVLDHFAEIIIEQVYDIGKIKSVVMPMLSNVK